MLKRIAIILMAVVLILTITACSKQDNEPVNKNSKVEYTVSETLDENEKSNKESDVITTVHSEKPTDNSKVSSETEAAEEVTTEKEKPVVTSVPSDS